jgi:hypothetical protein
MLTINIKPKEKENMVYITATFTVVIVSSVFVLKKPKMHWITID